MWVVGTYIYRAGVGTRRAMCAGWVGEGQAQDKKFLVCVTECWLNAKWYEKKVKCYRELVAQRYREAIPTKILYWAKIMPLPSWGLHIEWLNFHFNKPTICL